MFVLTMDQHGSTGGDDRVPELLDAIAHAAPEPLLPFERTAGDEVQGVLTDAAEVLDVVRTALRLGGWQVGVGIGPVTEPLPSSTRAGSGPAFVRARDAVERAKSRRLPVPVAVTGPEADDAAGDRGASALTAADAEGVLQLLGGVIERRSAAGWAAIDAVLGMEVTGAGHPDAAGHPHSAGHPQAVGRAARGRGVESRPRAEAAGLLGVTEQALSKRLRGASWQQECAVLPAVARILEEVDR